MNVPAVKTRLLRYRIMAWVVGTLLVLLVCVGMPLKYVYDNDFIVSYVGVAHGWLYVIFLLAIYDLKRMVNWSWKWFIGIALAGTIPFLSFVAEHFATRDVRRQIVAHEKAQHDQLAESPTADPTDHHTNDLA